MKENTSMCDKDASKSAIAPAFDHDPPRRRSLGSPARSLELEFH